MVNTAITYLYRDAHNHKQYEEVVLFGVLCADDEYKVFENLYENQWFVPSAIGLEDLQSRFGLIWDSLDYHPYHELLVLVATDREPTNAMTMLDFRDAIVSADWEAAALKVVKEKEEAR